MTDISQIFRQLSKFQPQCVDHFLISVLSAADVEERLISIGIFVQLWTLWVRDEENEYGAFSKPLSVLVDQMDDKNTDIARQSRAWLQCVDQSSHKYHLFPRRRFYFLEC